MPPPRDQGPGASAGRLPRLTPSRYRRILRGIPACNGCGVCATAAPDRLSVNGQSNFLSLMDPLIACLLKPAAYDHPVQAIQLVETHIS